jgi:hypothetical protein
MLTLTRTFIVTSNAKSNDQMQSKPIAESHATAAAKFENNELSAELEVADEIGLGAPLARK